MIHMNCCNYVMIKDLLLHYCFSSGLLCLNVRRSCLWTFSSHSLLGTWCLEQTHALFLCKSSPYSPLLQLVVWILSKTSLSHACLAYFQSWNDVVLSLPPFDHPFYKQIVTLNWWVSGSAPTAIQEWLPMLTFLSPLPGSEVEDFPPDWMTMINWFWGCIRYHNYQDCYCAPGNSTGMNLLG